MSSGCRLRHRWGHRSAMGEVSGPSITMCSRSSWCLMLTSIEAHDLRSALRVPRLCSDQDHPVG